VRRFIVILLLDDLTRKSILHDFLTMCTVMLNDDESSRRDSCPIYSEIFRRFPGLRHENSEIVRSERSSPVAALRLNVTVHSHHGFGL
jgi:hypothetical protein